MALNIKNPRTERLAQELAAATGESITEAVTVAVSERLAAVKRRGRHAATLSAIASIQAAVAALPDRDGRTPEEILGYDEHGLPS